MRRNQKGFTLMELMVVIVIIAILAAVAVPLYINYVNDAKRTEAKGAIGAIITAEQVYFQKNSAYTNETNAQFLAQSGNLNVDLSGTQAGQKFPRRQVYELDIVGFFQDGIGNRLLDMSSDDL